MLCFHELEFKIVQPFNRCIRQGCLLTVHGEYHSIVTPPMRMVTPKYGHRLLRRPFACVSLNSCGYGLPVDGVLACRHQLLLTLLLQSLPLPLQQ